MTTTTITMKLTADVIAAALSRANAAALSADPGPDNDGGTCNMDTALLRLPRVRQTVIDEAVRISGVKVGEPMTGFWHGYRFVWTARNGQAYRREVMAEAAYRSLRESGLDAHLWQQMD